jgi:hypothetical protein
MIHIAIRLEAYVAIEATLPGAMRPIERSESGKVLVWLDPAR